MSGVATLSWCSENNFLSFWGGGGCSGGGGRGFNPRAHTGVLDGMQADPFLG